MAKKRLPLYIHRITIMLIGLFLLIVLMSGAAHFIYRQEAELSTQKQQLSHILIQQVALSLEPLVERLGGNEETIPKITAVLDGLIKQKWILDASVYQLDGQLIASSGDHVSVRQRLKLDDNNSQRTNSQQIIEQITSNSDGPLGFIRITLDTEQLDVKPSQLHYTTAMIWAILLLSVVLGYILGQVPQMKRSPIKKRRKKTFAKPGQQQIEPSAQPITHSHESSLPGTEQTQ